MERVIQSIQLMPDGVSVTWFEIPDSFRSSGVSRTHQITIPNDPEYGEEIETLVDAASALLVDALEDFDGSEPWDPIEAASDDDAEFGE